MALTDYTSFDEVRSALGVDSDELQDTTLSLPRFETELGIALELVSVTLQSDFILISAIDVGTRTALEKSVYDRTRLFSAFSVASSCLSGLPLFTMKGESDNKADYTRFSGNLHEQVSENVMGALDSYRAALLRAYQTYKDGGQTVVSRPYFIAVSPTYDPVIGS